MKHLGFVKFIIELSENSSLYGVLIFDENIGRGEGSLYFYNCGVQIKDFEHKGTLEWAEKIIEIAKNKCEELGGILFKY